MKRILNLTILLLSVAMAIGCGGGGGGESSSSQSGYSSQSMPEIEAQVAALNAVRNRAITNPGSVSYEEAAVFFSENFGLENGNTRDERIITITDALSMVATISYASDFEYQQNSNGSYFVRYILYLSDGSRMYEARNFIKEGNGWKLIGNGKYALFSAYPKCILGINYDGSDILASGLCFAVNDTRNYDLQTAVVTGPGLPAEGLNFTKSKPYDSRLYLDNPWGTAWKLDSYGFYEMSDDVIGAIPDDAQYTIKFFKSDKSPVGTMTTAIRKRPYKISELGPDYTAHFPSTTMSHNLSDIRIGDNWNIRYSKPAEGELGFIYMYARIEDSNYLPHFQKSTSLPFNQASYTVPVNVAPFTPYWGYLEIRSYDLSGRMTELQWILN